MAAGLFALQAGAVAADDGAGKQAATATADPAKAALDGLMLGRAADREVSPLFAAAPLLADHRPDANGAIVLDRRERDLDPLLAGLIAAVGVAAGLELLRRLMQGRRARPAALVDRRFEAQAFVPAGRRRSVEPPMPVPAAAARRDYIRIDDAAEVWTPAKVAATRDPAVSRHRRRTDSGQSDYRFHRLNGDGSVKTAQRRTFSTEAEARKFAESIGEGDAVEVWLADRCLSTVPPTFLL